MEDPHEKAAEGEWGNRAWEAPVYASRGVGGPGPPQHLVHCEEVCPPKLRFLTEGSYPASQ